MLIYQTKNNKFIFLKPLFFNYIITKINDHNEVIEYKNDYNWLYKKNNSLRIKQKLNEI